MLSHENKQALSSVIPIFVSLTFFSAISLVDIFFAGLLGPGAQAALGVADQIVFLNMLVLNGFCAGVNTMIAQSRGAGQEVVARAYMKNSMIAATALGIAATLVGYLSAGAIAGAFACDLSVKRQAASFIELCALGNLPWALVVCQGAIFRASGRAALSVLQWLLVAVICIGGELISFFVLPWGSSLAPLAISWDIAIAAGCLYGLCQMRQSSAREKLIWANKFSIAQFISQMRALLSVGIPVMIGEMCWLFSNLLLFALLSFLPQATAAQAAWTVHLKIEETVAYVPLLAVCQATASIVGNRVGAGGHGCAWRFAMQMALAAALCMLVVGLVTAGLSPYMVQWASGDVQVRLLANQLLMGSIIVFPVNAFALVLAAALEGAGATVLPACVNVFALLIVRLPFAWIFALPLGWGVAGAWMAKCLSNLAAVCGMLQIFKRRSATFEVRSS